MTLTVHPGFLRGDIASPPSKSYFQRALVAALLAEGKTLIYNAGNSRDETDMLLLISKLGATVLQKGNHTEVHGGLKVPASNIVIGESGLGSRLIMPVLALGEQAVTLSGKGSLLNRPMTPIADIIHSLGGVCRLRQGKLPVTIQGPIGGGQIEIDGSVSSQFLSGLLFALPTRKENSVISVSNLKSRSYVDMTLSVLRNFSIEITHQAYSKFFIPGNQQYQPTTYTVEGDWSNAAFLMVAAAINGELTIHGLNPESIQGDRKIIEALLDSGVSVSQEADYYRIEKTDNLKAFDFNATDMPDLFPPLACLAAYCQGTSRIKGAHRLVHKESNRAKSLTREFKRMGIEVGLEDDDTMVIQGAQPQGGSFHTHNDHRIAMAGAVLALRAQRSIQIEQPEAVQKSYPGFYDALKSLGARLDDGS